MRGRSLIGAGLVAGAAVGHLLPGTVAWRAARCRILPRLSGVGDADHVALTFDDGPDPRSTPAILDALDTLTWRATFFLLGDQVRRAPRLARELVERGHEVGVHGDVHTSHLRRPPWTVTADVRSSRRLIEDTTGRPVRWLRPPYGALSSSTLVAARRSGLQLVLWTTWGADWRGDASGGTVADTVADTFVPGATVLLHDSDVTSAPGSWRATAAALPRLADTWSRAGLRVGPLAEHGIGGPG